MTLQVGVKLLLKNKNGLCLLIQRRNPLPDGSTWDIPGGRIEPTESLHDALKREVFEETGLTLDVQEFVPKLIKAQDIFVPGADLHVVRLTYMAELDGEAVLSHEHQGYIWATLQDGLEMNIDPYLREVLEELPKALSEVKGSTQAFNI